MFYVIDNTLLERYLESHHQANLRLPKKDRKEWCHLHNGDLKTLSIFLHFESLLGYFFSEIKLGAFNFIKKGTKRIKLTLSCAKTSDQWPKRHLNENINLKFQFK